MKYENFCLNNAGLGTLRNAKGTAAVNKDADSPIFNAVHDGTAGELLQIPGILKRYKVNYRASEHIYKEWTR